MRWKKYLIFFPCVYCCVQCAASTLSNGRTAEILIEADAVKTRNEGNFSNDESSVLDRRSSIVSLKKRISDRKRNILIIMSDTGGGHRASADALNAAIDCLYPNQFNTSIVDIWTKYGTWPYDSLVQTYRFLGQRPLLWRLTYELGRIPPIRFITELWVGFLCWKGFSRCFKEYDPDMIVSVHPLCQQLPLAVLKKMGRGKRKVPFVTVVTDLASAHPTWFHKNTDRTYVPSERLRNAAFKSGLDPGKVRITGLPLRETYWSDLGVPKKSKARNHLNLSRTIPLAVIVGGGEGVGRLSEIAIRTADQLSKDIPLSQLAIVCGKNESAKEMMSSRKWPSNVRVEVLGFIPNLDTYMSAADLLITKAGPGTIAEACSLGVPLVISSFLPGQEKGNVSYVTEGGFGFYESKPKKLAKVVSSLLMDPMKLQDMGKRAAAAGKPMASLSIVSDMIQTILLPNISQ